MAMTPYAMTGHLFLNLLWLWLFLADTRRGHLLAALVGFVACGLHQPHIHPLFILPFMTSLLWQRRWRLAFAYALWYATVLVLWIFWRDIATWLVTDGAVIAEAGREGTGSSFLSGIAAALGKFNAGSLLLLPLNLARFIAWQSPLAVLLFIPALAGLRQAPPLVRLLLWSMLLTTIVHALLTPSQGHGWGYRYLHVHLGSVALVAVWGWLRTRETLDVAGQTALVRMGTVLVLAAVLVALPLRMVQTESFVRPFALGDRYVKSVNADLVFIDTEDISCGVDLTRNDPMLRNRPKVMTARLTPAAALQRVCPGKSAVLIDYPAVAHLGMHQRPRPPADREARYPLLRQHLMENGCSLLDTPKGRRILPTVAPGQVRDYGSLTPPPYHAVSATNLRLHTLDRAPISPRKWVSNTRSKCDERLRSENPGRIGCDALPQRGGDGRYLHCKSPSGFPGVGY